MPEGEGVGVERYSGERCPTICARLFNCRAVKASTVLAARPGKG
jgi:hypothetical protein